MTDAVSRQVEIAADHPAFDGHFPGQPLLPGVAILAEVLEAAHADATLAACIGPAPRLGVAKFLAPVRPGATLAIEFRLGATALAWTVRDGEQVAASGQFGRADITVARPR